MALLYASIMADDMKPISASDLYEKDFYAWTEEQAEQLRTLQVDASMAGIDWLHLAEEIEDMGKRDKNGYRSAIRNIIVHLFKLAWTQNDAVKGHWRAEIRNFRNDAEDVETTRIRNVVSPEIEALHNKAAEIARDAFSSDEPESPTDTSLRWTLEQILGETDDPLEV